MYDGQRLVVVVLRYGKQSEGIRQATQHCVREASDWYHQHHTYYQYLCIFRALQHLTTIIFCPASELA